MNTQQANLTAQQVALSLATEEERGKALAQQEANAKTACLCTITNPGKRAQVIYDGITNMVPIKFDPRETKQGVRLAEHMVVRLQDDEMATDDPENPNLRVVDWSPAPPEVPAAARPARKPRPARAPAAA